MAQIALGVGSSHAPQLSTPPEDWGLRATADRRNTALAFRGRTYAFEELRAVRGAAFAAECEPSQMRERHTRSRAAIDQLAAAVRDRDLDVLVIVSSDHKETFTDELLAPFAVYWGETVQHEPLTQEDLDAMPPGLAVAEVANVPEVSTTRTCHPDLALHLIRSAGAAGFDVGASRMLPAGRYGDHGIPHGWGFVLQQILGEDGQIPIVPVFVNTFWQPNPPSARRCHDLGVALGEAIAGFPADLRVGVVASGGLSHFVLDEDLDRGFLDALCAEDADRMSGLADDLLVAGSSELRNWIVVAGALAGRGLRAEVVDYVPCYRTDAGTGCGMGFVTWTPDAEADAEAAGA
ncbi:hypothetical protein GCM10027062_18770 [Nocardioides hungaricus]